MTPGQESTGGKPTKKRGRTIVLITCVQCRKQFQPRKPSYKRTFCGHECLHKWEAINLTKRIFCRVCQTELSKKRKKRYRYRGYTNAYCGNACYLYHRAQVRHMKTVVIPEWEAIKKAVNERIYRELKEWWDNGGCRYSRYKNLFLDLPPEFWKVAPKELKDMINAAARIRRLSTPEKRQALRRKVRETALDLIARPGPRDHASTEQDVQREMEDSQ